MGSGQRYELGSTICPTCGDKLNTEQGVRIHHAKKHDDPLPNRVCKSCDSIFYDSRSSRMLCDDCSNNFRYSDIPEDVRLSEDEWKALTPHQRWYKRNSDIESKRVQENKEARVDWIKREFLVDANCNRCGFKDSRAIQFHHTNENELTESPLQMGRNMRSKKVIKKELERGELLCANCHMIEHQSERFE